MRSRSENAPQIFTIEYYERMRLLEADGWWNAAMRDVGAMLLSDVQLPKEGLMLDIGCGSGQTSMWFSALYPEWRTAGLDIAPEGLAAAHELGVPVTRSSALALPHPDKCADAVISLDVVQHLPLAGGDIIAMGEMHRVLKPGGTLLLRTNAQAYPRTPDDTRFAFHRYEPAELRKKLESSGFDVLRLSRINAILGLAEIPRELRASRSQPSAYHGILARPGRRSWSNALKRKWLRLEGRMIRAGVPLPVGRTILALCARRATRRFRA
jgi:SAM-dependent methyltransferase